MAGLSVPPLLVRGGQKAAAPPLLSSLPLRAGAAEPLHGTDLGVRIAPDCTAALSLPMSRIQPRLVWEGRRPQTSQPHEGAPHHSQEFSVHVAGMRRRRARKLATRCALVIALAFAGRPGRLPNMSPVNPSCACFAIKAPESLSFSRHTDGLPQKERGPKKATRQNPRTPWGRMSAAKRGTTNHRPTPHEIPLKLQTKPHDHQANVTPTMLTVTALAAAVLIALTDRRRKQKQSTDPRKRAIYDPKQFRRRR